VIALFFAVAVSGGRHRAAARTAAPARGRDLLVFLTAVLVVAGLIAGSSRRWFARPPG
jgi:hypothetical protein